jgi:AraC-like DNA-binding protein
MAVSVPAMQTVRRANVSDHPSLLTLAEAKIYAFTTGVRRRPPGHFIWHYHPETQLVWTARGHGLRCVGRSVERFEPGDLVLLGANLPHMWAAADHEAISTVIHFLPERWGADFWQLPEVHKLGGLLAAAARGLRFTGPEARKVGRAIENLAAQPAHNLESLIRFLGICRRLVHTPHYSLNALPAEEGGAERDPRLDQVLEWIQRRAAEPITQEQAAAEVGMSPAAFSRWFKRCVGHVFHRHLNELRVALVCARLSSGPESITEAAFQSGYNNLANFNRRFREVTGFTPSEFRLRARRMQQDSGEAFVMRLGRNGAVRVTPTTATAREDGRRVRRG